MAETPTLWTFPGGVELDPHKAESTGSPIRIADIPRRLYLPLSQHAGEPASPVVAVGDRVLRGQPIAQSGAYIGSNIHASSSGTVVALDECYVPHLSGMTAPCLVIETDGKDEPWDGYEPITNYRTLNSAALRSRIRDAGIVGLGGAVFPTAVKMNVAVGLEALVLNGAECEPWIACDEMMMRERAAEIIAGVQVMLHVMEVFRCIIAVEDSKPEAYDALAAAIQRVDDPRIELVAVPTRYPEGGERQLIQVLSGREVPYDGIPADIGFVCQNVQTAAAVARAVIYGEPAISRIVTVTGDGVAEPGNLEVRYGTPMREVIDQCGGYTEGATRLIMGGAMMGVPLATDDGPVVKATNCLLVAGEAVFQPRAPEMPCIRCGDCATVCPATLLPQQLYWHAKSDSFDRAESLNLFDCIECGSCDVVCPSHIPLTSYFRYAKSEIWAARRERQRAEISRRRFEAHKERADAVEAERQARLAKKTKALEASGDAASRKSLIDDIVAQAKARTDGSATTDQDAQKGDNLEAEKDSR